MMIDTGLKLYSEIAIPGHDLEVKVTVLEFSYKVNFLQ